MASLRSTARSTRPADKRSLGGLPIEGDRGPLAVRKSGRKAYRKGSS